MQTVLDNRSIKGKIRIPSSDRKKKKKEVLDGIETPVSEKKNEKGGFEWQKK